LNVILLLLCGTASAQAVPERVDALSLAIGKAEGFAVHGSKPARNHNPGDLVAHSHYRVFRTDAEGYEALRDQLYKIAEGKSKVYTLDMTIRRMGKRYAGSPAWSRNIARTLHISEDTTLSAWLLAPQYSNAQHNAG
jgi:hypothetical protein